MKVLDRYIVRNFLISYLILAFVLVGLYVLVDLTINGSDFTKQSDEAAGDVLGDVGNYYGHQVFAIFKELSGIITLASATVTLTTMNRRNEMTALLASGVSLHRVIWPVIVLGLVFNLITVADQELVLPRMADQLVRSPNEQAHLKEFPVYSAWLRDAWSDDDRCVVSGVDGMDDRPVRPGDVQARLRVAPAADPASPSGQPSGLVNAVRQARADDVLAIHVGRSGDVRVYVKVPADPLASGDRLAVTTAGVAQQGHEGLPAAGDANLAAVQPGDLVTPVVAPKYYVTALKFSPEPHKYRMTDLVVIKLNGQPGGEPIVRINAPLAKWVEAASAWELLDPDVIFIKPAGAENDLSSTQPDRPATLLIHPDNTPREMVLRSSSQRWMQFMSTADLREYSRSRDRGATQQARSIMHIRFTQPVINMILLLLGVPFALTRAPVNLLQNMVRCALVSGACFVVSFVFQQVSSDAQTWAVVAAWLPVIIFAPVAVLMLDSVKT